MHNPFNLKPATWNFTEKRALPCGCEIEWDPVAFERMRKVGAEAAEPGEEVMTEEGVLRLLGERHVCPKV
jgi:hypothetical protein